MTRSIGILFLLPSLILVFSCAKEEMEVVVYTSLDQVYSEPILSAFEKETGIKTKAVYDIEAAKTTGLVNRLIAEKNNPQADVFWNSEVARTIVLKEKGVLAPYDSPLAEDIPELFRDPDRYWTGFAARARVLVYNTDLVSTVELPKSIFDLVRPEWKGQVAFANPLFGTTATHVAALFVSLGDEKAKEYLQALKDNEVVMVAGNAMVCSQVAAGEVKIGFTDTDDVNASREDGKHVAMVYPDQDEVGMGTLVIPNTVGMIANCPHPKAAERFIDYLLSKEVESKLAHSRSVQMPVRPSVKTPENVRSIGAVKAMEVDFEKIAHQMDNTARFVQELFIE